jgi:hypothetical protein
MARIRALEGQ